jgi:hypothetical protein
MRIWKRMSVKEALVARGTSAVVGHAIGSTTAAALFGRMNTESGIATQAAAAAARSFLLQR